MMNAPLRDRFPTKRRKAFPWKIPIALGLLCIGFVLYNIWYPSYAIPEGLRKLQKKKNGLTAVGEYFEGYPTYKIFLDDGNAAVGVSINVAQGDSHSRSWVILDSGVLLESNRGFSGFEGFTEELSHLDQSSEERFIENCKSRLGFYER